MNLSSNLIGSSTTPANLDQLALKHSIDPNLEPVEVLSFIQEIATNSEAIEAICGLDEKKVQFIVDRVYEVCYTLFNPSRGSI